MMEQKEVRRGRGRREVKEPRSINEEYQNTTQNGEKGGGKKTNPHTWKQTRSAPSMPSRISLRPICDRVKVIEHQKGFELNVRGKHLKTSQLGKGVCTKRLRSTSGIDSRTSLGGGRRGIDYECERIGRQTTECSPR
jgi:hypothetical protein